ncbi:MAG: glycoside hydrolase family 15 protein, partial [Acidobacteriota bacterium]
MSYQPIEDYGIIGNMHTTALVGMDGSIDWFCTPYFDSPRVFAAILDDKKGGRFRIRALDDHVTRKQFYWPDTNVLVTRFLSPEGVGEVVDFMPVKGESEAPASHTLIRSVGSLRGTVTFQLHCHPAFDYARASHETRLTPEGALFLSRRASLGLASRIPLVRDQQGVRAEFCLQEGERAVFILQPVDPGQPACLGLSEARADRLFRRTVEYWRRWSSRCTYTGRWREMIQRSALALKLLTFEPSGAIVAAPTCSLPEHPGGSRNWDYRYTWIRDAAFTIYGLLRIGYTEEAARFMVWLEKRAH